MAKTSHYNKGAADDAFLSCQHIFVRNFEFKSLRVLFCPQKHETPFVRQTKGVSFLVGLAGLEPTTSRV